MVLPIFKSADTFPFALHLSAAGEERPLGADLNATIRWPDSKPALQVRTVQVNTQQDAKEVTWLAPARLFARNAARNNLTSLAGAGGALQFDMRLVHAPVTPVGVAMGCGPGCEATVDLTPALAKLATGQKHTITVPLACFAQRGADLSGVETPFAIKADAPFAAAFANIRITAGAADHAGAIECGAMQP